MVTPVVGTRHNRSRSDIVGSFAQKMVNDNAGEFVMSSSSLPYLGDQSAGAGRGSGAEKQINIKQKDCTKSLLL